MKYSSGTCGRIFYLHREHGEDPIRTITAFVSDQGISAGFIHFIGAIKNAELVTGLFSRRGFNIESLAVGPCEQPATSRITIVVTGNDVPIEPVKKQLNKLIEVIKVLDVSDAEHV